MAGGPTFLAPIHGKIIVREQYPRNRPLITFCSPGANGLNVHLDDEFLAAWRPICGIRVILDEILENPGAHIGMMGAKRENIDNSLEFVCPDCGADHSQIQYICQCYEGWEEEVGRSMG